VSGGTVPSINRHGRVRVHNRERRILRELLDLERLERGRPERRETHGPGHVDVRDDDVAGDEAVCEVQVAAQHARVEQWEGRPVFRGDIEPRGTAERILHELVSVDERRIDVSLRPVGGAQHVGRQVGLDRGVHGARRQELVPGGPVLDQRAADQQNRKDHGHQSHVSKATPGERERENEPHDRREPEDREFENPKGDEQAARDGKRGGCDHRDECDDEQDEQDPGGRPRGTGQPIRAAPQNENADERREKENEQGHPDYRELVGRV